ncbi:MAG: STAS domain-containing protein [Terriglobia bacterium]
MAITTQIRHDGQVSVLCVQGRLILGEPSDAFRAAIEEMLQAGDQDIVVNFEEVPFADSAGVGALAVNFSNVRAAGGSLALVGAQKAVRDVLEITRLSDLIPLFENEREAIESLAVKRQAPPQAAN